MKLFVAMLASSIVLVLPAALGLFTYWNLHPAGRSGRIGAALAILFVLPTAVWGYRVWWPNWVAWRMRKDIFKHDR